MLVRILKEFFVTCEVSPEQCKEALKREIRQDGLKKILEDISIAEKNRDFPAVEEAFKVIDSNTITAVIDDGLQLRLDSGEKVLVEDLQKFSVQIWSYRKDEWALRECSRFPGVMFWEFSAYDGFLGYMAGVLKVLDFKMGKSITL